MATALNKAIAIVEKLGGSVELRKGRVWEVRLIDTTATDAQLASLPALKDAEVVSLVETRVKGPGLSVFTGWKRLASLYLSLTPVTDKGLAMLPPLPALEVLILDFTKVGDGGLKELSRFPNLRELNLGGTKCTDAGLAEVCEVGTLEMLGLHYTGVTDEGLKSVAKLPRLKKLYWSEPNISPKGVRSLKKSLPNLKAMNVARGRWT